MALTKLKEMLSGSDYQSPETNSALPVSPCWEPTSRNNLTHNKVLSIEVQSSGNWMMTKFNENRAGAACSPSVSMLFFQSLQLYEVGSSYYPHFAEITEMK